MQITPAALSVVQAAQYLGVSRASVYRLMNSGDLRTTKLGGRTLIRRVDADALLEASVGAVVPRGGKTKASGDQGSILT